MAEFYEELASCQVAGVPIGKYKSLKTGLVVCTAQTEGPLINGYFCLGKLCYYSPEWVMNEQVTTAWCLFTATEAHDHDGLPHTLEHLVFMGSEQFPYKV